MTVKLRAPAKINLALHITGQRDDGYHLLDSLVAFGPAYDVVQVARADANVLDISGPEAGTLTADADNLVLRAARLLNVGAAHFHLEKNLPVASGIGGGSSDAAAALRGLLMVYDADHGLHGCTDARLEELCQRMLALGADIPMCLLPQSLRARGIGEKITPIDLPPMACVLVNPRVEIPTPSVFKALVSKNNPSLPEEIPVFGNASVCIEWLNDQRNDLQAPARILSPKIDQVLDMIKTRAGCGLARMSGSGATCFGLFADPNKAKAAARAIAAECPNWWVAGGIIADGHDWCAPIG